MTTQRPCGGQQIPFNINGRTREKLEEDRSDRRLVLLGRDSCAVEENLLNRSAYYGHQRFPDTGPKVIQRLVVGIESRALRLTNGAIRVKQPPVNLRTPAIGNKDHKIKDRSIEANPERRPCCFEHYSNRPMTSIRSNTSAVCGASGNSAVKSCPAQCS